MHNREDALAILRQLPHWQHVSIRLDAWFAMQERHPAANDSAEEFAIKSGFFDAHEIAVLVQNANSIYSEHGAARDICAEKLLLKPSRLPNADAHRCLATESQHLKLFLDKHRSIGMTVDTQAEWQANAFSKDWLRFGQSRIMRIENNARILVAFDSPLSADGRIDFKHAAQLHYDALVAQRAGIQIDSMVFSKLDMKLWELMVIPVEFKPQLAAEILRAGNHYWSEYVQQDRLPEIVPKPQMTLTVTDEAARSRLLEKADKIAFYKLLGDAAYGQFKTLEADFRTELDRHQIGNATLALRALKVETKETFNAEAAARALGDRASEAQLSGAVGYDAERLLAIIRQDPAFDIDNFMSADYRFLLGKSPKLSAFREQLSIETSALLEKHLDSLKAIDDLSESKIVPATEIVSKPARNKLASS